MNCENRVRNGENRSLLSRAVKFIKIWIFRGRQFRHWRNAKWFYLAFIDKICQVDKFYVEKNWHIYTIIFVQNSSNFYVYLERLELQATLKVTFILLQYPLKKILKKNDDNIIEFCLVWNLFVVRANLKGRKKKRHQKIIYIYIYIS